MGTRPQIGSVVVARLEKIDAFFPHEVHEPVFLARALQLRDGEREPESLQPSRAAGVARRLSG